MDIIYTMSEVFKLLGDKTRLTILAILREKELCVCDIVDILDVSSQSSISQHLRKLKSASLVKETRRGQWIYYSLAIDDKPYVQDVLKHIPSLQSKIEELESKANKVVCD
ncbi:ArsR/SmtB family transcription factor [Paenibacillus alginolyticus]|uniref:Metalloregulator ArsR/SmtB family transcription factor n=1 Tax=Paenibacillus alginolyticus TaxID=59839 RepID=A0ABT4G7U0_9BACL|nr:metalloregulator ArsR/SmtB family transcription factor [Paenibacillus alginolyticus]MCY9692215.1 metalloregulator ArsR/SmtB family transcription factor [Paenibacillus alginolyticus]MEC0145946.1 metalloregulator ArsR/SmtB family transcription factor [Paenibacillus alginolyticus]